MLSFSLIPLLLCDFARIQNRICWLKVGKGVKIINNTEIIVPLKRYIRVLRQLYIPTRDRIISEYDTTLI